MNHLTNKNNNRKNLKNRLILQVEELMRMQRVSKAELSNRSGIIKSSITAIFKNGYGSQIQTLQEVCRALGADLLIREIDMIDQKQLPEIWQNPTEIPLPNGHKVKPSSSKTKTKSKGKIDSKWDLKRFGL